MRLLKNKPSWREIPIAFSALAAFLFFLVWSGSSTFCYFRTMTGLPCPGCGLTTAGLALVHGEWKNALTAHAGIFLLPLILFFLSFHRRFKAWSEKICLMLLIVFLIYFIIRVILFFPNGPYPMVYTKQNVFHKLLLTHFEKEKTQSLKKPNDPQKETSKRP